MYLIVGLGNPGRQYEATRHNMGFDVIDKLVEEYQIPQGGVKFNAMYGKGIIGGQHALLMKPLSYMNLSGGPVREMANYFKIDPETEMIVIYDDIDLDPGQLRIRKKGSAGGHNGIKNIILHTGSQNFNRIRVGIDRSKYIKVVDYVLSRFTSEEQEAIEQGVENASDAIIDYLEHGFNHAMNRFN